MFRVPLHWTSASLGFAATALVAAATTGSAQVAIRPGAAVQLTGLNGPLGGQSGLGPEVSATLTTRLGFEGSFAADFAILSHGDRISLCFRRPDGECLQRPNNGSIAGFAFALGFQAPGGRVLRPFIGVGPAVRLASGPVQVGERRVWATPQVEGGLRLAAGGAQWALSVRWRRVDRWEGVGPFRELALLVGIRRGGQF